MESKDFIRYAESMKGVEYATQGIIPFKHRDKMFDAMRYANAYTMESPFLKMIKSQNKKNDKAEWHGRY